MDIYLLLERYNVMSRPHYSVKADKSNVMKYSEVRTIYHAISQCWIFMNHLLKALHNCYDFVTGGRNPGDRCLLHVHVHVKCKIMSRIVMLCSKWLCNKSTMRLRNAKVTAMPHVTDNHLAMCADMQYNFFWGEGRILNKDVFLTKFYIRVFVMYVMHISWS